MPTLSATEVAYLMVACQQAVLAVGWVVSAAVVRFDRAPAVHWAGYALLTGASLVIFVWAAQQRDDELRALGNLCAAAGLLLMERGVRRFTGQPAAWWVYALVMGVVLTVSWLGMEPRHGALRIAVVSGVLGLICAMTAWSIFIHARRGLLLRWGAWLALPLLLGAAVFAARSGRAILSPATVVAEVMANTSLNIGTAVTFMVIALVFHLALVALVGARLLGEVRRLSRVDGLTELLNRRAIEELMHDEARRAARSQRPFSVVMIDADHFKGINDRFGHAAGDEALRHLARTLRAQMRDIDQMGRFGGEEFVALLPGTAASEAVSVAERLREALRECPWVWEGETLPLTVSMGVTAWRGPQDALETLLKRADEALYRAKSLGRDRCEWEA